MTGTGSARSAPFLITRRVPDCSATKMRPSGAKAIAVGLASPPATIVSLKPAGSVAAVCALEPPATKTDITAVTTRIHRALPIVLPVPPRRLAKQPWRINTGTQRRSPTPALRLSGGA